MKTITEEHRLSTYTRPTYQDSEIVKGAKCDDGWVYTCPVCKTEGPMPDRKEPFTCEKCGVHGQTRGNSLVLQVGDPIDRY